MQNKANFKKAGMNVRYYLQKDCENEPGLCRLGKQSETKPIFLLSCIASSKALCTLAGAAEASKPTANKKMIVMFFAFSIILLLSELVSPQDASRQSAVERIN